MRRRAVVAAALVTVAVLTGCADDAALPGADEVRSIDLSPSEVLVLDARDDDLDVEVRARSVLAIRNDDAEAHRLVGEGFDTGLLAPGDETLVTFSDPATIPWRDRDGDLTGTITVVAAP